MIFRYPGGKSKLLEPIKEHLYPLIEKSNGFTEPFTGGGSVLVQVAKDFPEARLFANDKDITIYSFWLLFKYDFDEYFEELYKLIRQKPTVDLFIKMREDGIPKDEVGRAYYAIFFNRTTFSGIQTSGPIGGYSQSSKYKIDCRYNAERIIKECEALRVLFKDRLDVRNDDCVDFVQHLPEMGAYLDPPYYVKGKELYPTFMQDKEHDNLAETLRGRKMWVLSYDICPEIDELYSWANRIPLDARYSITDRKKTWVDKKEYIILPQRESNG